MSKFTYLFSVQKATHWLPILFRVKVQEFTSFQGLTHCLPNHLSLLICHYFPSHCLLRSPNTPGIEASPFMKPLSILPQDIPRANYPTFGRFFISDTFNVRLLIQNFNTSPSAISYSSSSSNFSS